MDAVTAFGAVAVTAMMPFYALEDRAQACKPRLRLLRIGTNPEFQARSSVRSSLESADACEKRFEAVRLKHASKHRPRIVRV